MKNLNKAIIGLILLSSFISYAQLNPVPKEANLTPNKQELSLTLGGLYTSLDYDLPETDIKTGQGFNIGLEYTYYFSNNFGLSTGAEYQHSRATARTETFAGNYQSIDFEQEDFEFGYTMNQLVEEQTINFVNIPLQLVYQNQQYGFYLRAGAKIGLPIKSKYSSTYTLHTSGYYPQYNGELFDPAFMGFGNLGRINASGNQIDTKPTYILSFEIGSKGILKIGNLYGGIFVDYGLNNITKKGSHPIVYGTNESGVDFNFNSVLNSDQVSNLKTKAFGIKLRYSFIKL